MNASEAMYFDGAPYAHIVAHEENEVSKRRASKAREFARDYERRTGSRRVTV